MDVTMSETSCVGLAVTVECLGLRAHPMEYWRDQVLEQSPALLWSSLGSPPDVRFL